MQILNSVAEHSKNFLIRVLGGTSLAASGLGYILEHYFGTSGCVLCQIERIFLAVCGVVALLMASTRSKLVTTGHAALWKAGALVSLYHSLIQFGVLPVPAFCQVAPVMGRDLQEKLSTFLNMPHAPCNKVTMSILGIPLPVYLVLFFAFGAVLIYVLKLRKPQAESQREG
jgi:disulfide bond formation protein DsbB